MSQDPFRYFRIEARELVEGLTSGTLELARGSGGSAPVARLLRFAHTLKGAARIVKQRAIADHAHSIEDVLATYREAPSGVPKERVDEVLALIDAITHALVELDSPTTTQHKEGTAAPAIGAISPIAAREPQAFSPQGSGPSGSFETVRVQLAEMDTLMEGIAEVGVQAGAIRHATEAIGDTMRTARKLEDRLAPRLSTGAANIEGLSQVRSLVSELCSSLGRAHQDLAASTERAERELEQVRERATQLRLIPAGMIFDALERAARDAASELTRKVLFVATGAEVRLDQNVLSALRDALLHVVRNAVAHGIESDPERAALGKPTAGRVQLHVERHATMAVFACKDDGRGIDVEAVKSAALAGGLLSTEQADEFRLEDAVRLLLRGGLSTSKTVSQISGRGIGLQVLENVAARYGGEVALSSTPGQGTTVEIRVPLSLFSLPTLVTEVAGLTALLPLDAVQATILVPSDDIMRSAEGDSVFHEDRAVPFVPLARLLDLAALPRQSKAPWTVVVVRAADAVAALGVDRIRGIQRVVVRPLPASCNASHVLAGASLDADGNPLLVLDPAGLVTAARDAGRTEIDEPTAKPPLLVIDDSLTTRMLERTILETAGYEVDVAVSAEEGLEKAGRRRYGVFIVDVEMPGMDGFEFVARTRADASLRDVPAILVTSLATPEHRRRGMQAGARAYIVKGEFDEGLLLSTIASLVG